MKCLTKEFQTSSTWLEYGKVVLKGDNNRFLITTSNGEFFAEKAVSCIIEPEIGDNVLISINDDGNTFILSILQRESDKKKNDIILSGDINIISKEGNVNIKAQTGIEISTYENLTFTSNSVEMNAQSSKIIVNRLSFVGKIFYGQIKTIKMVCASAEQIIGRLTQKLQNCFNFVKEHHEIQAGSSRYLVEETLTVQSKNAVHQAEEVLTINGEEVHLG
ncbi:DUF3540 domain-containing protein [Deferribacter abyssi]|uniref:DUF3540 domain-containing protein n=1 Tax=Deferribacter abyssi TaxID=213806 RepID=UPI003C2141F9